MTAPQTVAVADISVDRRFLLAMVDAIGGDARAHPEHNRVRVSRYVRSLRKGATFPPVVLVQSARDGKLFLLDGLHRLKAHKAVGRATIDAIILSEDGFKAALPMAVLTRLPARRGVSVSLPLPLGPGPQGAAPGRGGRVFRFCRYVGRLIFVPLFERFRRRAEFRRR